MLSPESCEPGDGGQAVVEVALALPLLMVFVLGTVQLAVVVRDQLAVELAAREGARAAVVAADPAASAQRAAAAATALRPLDVAASIATDAVTVTVHHVDPTDVPIIGMLLPDVDVSASVTMALEPP
jgi:Flp pilus assembly protein TadG